MYIYTQFIFISLFQFLSTIIFLVTLLLIQVPVGTSTLGRIMNVIGEPIDERGDISMFFVKALIINIYDIL